MSNESTAKKDTQKLQRAIVDALEDVKAQNIVVFNTEHLSPLFERVIVASGTSNRQTKALAASVRDKVREAGFPKPRTEGEDNGEWIIVDCGAAVAHVMQPGIRQYYHLEEIWGDKPVRLKLGAPKPAAPAKAVAKPATPTSTKTSARGSTKTGAAGTKAAAPKAAKPAVKTAAQAAAKAPAKTPVKTARKAAPAAGAKPAQAKAKASATSAAAKKTSAKTGMKAAKKTAKPAAAR